MAFCDRLVGADSSIGEADLNFQQAIVSDFKRYVDFNGRSARSEYWWWVLMIVVIDVAFSLLEMIAGGPTSSMYGVINGINLLISLGLFLPGLAVAIRRLHDTNRSAWWVLIALTGVGIIVLIVWYCMRGTIGENQYGPDPLGADTGAPAAPTQGTWAS